MAKKGNATLRVDVLTDRAAVASIEDDWAELAATAAVGPFGLPSFALSWWYAFGQGRLLVAVARRGDRLVGVLPLHERSYGPGPAAARVVRWLGHGLGVVGAAVLAPDLGSKSDEVADRLWAAVAEEAGPRSALQLVEHLLDAPGLGALRRCEAWDVTAQLASRVPVIDLVDRTVDDLLAGSSKRKFRWKLSAAERDLEADGVAWRVEIVDTVERFDEVLPAIDAAFDAAEDDDAKLHFLAGDHREPTLFALRAELARSAAVVAVLWLDERVGAFDVSVRVGDRLCGYIRRTDPAARRYSPGHLLLRAGVADAIERGVAVFDLGLGLDAYKKHWATGVEHGVVVTGGRAGRGPLARAAVGALDGLFELRSRASRDL